MKLSTGATGFGSGTTHETADLSAFTALCHHAARATNGTVTHVIAAGVTPSFHTINIAHRQHHTAVLRHATLPLLAFAAPRSDGETTLTFLDDHDLAAAITEVSDLQIMTARQLSTPLTQTDLSDLHPSEHNQINYWKPNTVGELLFNFWD
jgi:hypothetical protein